MKIIAVGKNYEEHALEFDGTSGKPENPMIFMKPDSAIMKNGKHFYLPDFMGRIDYEAEIVVRINKLFYQKQLLLYYTPTLILAANLKY